MATVSSLGMSGLPLEDLLNNIRKSENNALVLIQDRKAATESKVSAYGKLQSAVTAMQTAAKAVANQTDAFGAMKAATSSDAFSATPGNTAIAGQYSIQVDTLASAQTLVAATGRVNRTDPIGADGSIAITLGDGTTHSLDMTGKDTSLNGLVAAINADADIGVNATLVNDGSGTPYRLLLTARDTGTDASIAKIEVTGNTDLQSFIGFDKAGSTANFAEQAASNATLSINGIQIQSQTNTIKDAIDGVELTLTKTTTTPSTLTITRDNEAATKAVNDFVTAYNSLQDTIKSLTSYDPDGDRGSALTGDSLARRVQSELRGAINGAASNGTTLRSLSELGITTDPKTGKLTVDDTKLSAALSDNPQDVTAMFTGATGVGKLMSEATDRFTRSGGLFSTATDGLNRTLDTITKQYNATADRIDQRMETYRLQFVKLDTMVVQMNGISSYLTQQLSMLSSPSAK